MFSLVISNDLGLPELDKFGCRASNYPLGSRHISDAMAIHSHYSHLQS